MSTAQYDDLWRTAWGDMQHYGPVHRHTLEDLVRTVCALDVKSVLYVGCGSGENLAALATCNRFELSGADVSDEALNLARQRVPSARFQKLDAQREALTEKFDLVMSIQVVEHLYDEYLLSATWRRCLTSMCSSRPCRGACVNRKSASDTYATTARRNSERKSRWPGSKFWTYTAGAFPFTRQSMHALRALARRPADWRDERSDKACGTRALPAL